MKTTKRPAWQITPGTHILIDGKTREVVNAWPVGGGRLGLSWNKGPDHGYIHREHIRLDRLAPVIIVLDPGTPTAWLCPQCGVVTRTEHPHAPYCAVGHADVQMQRIPWDEFLRRLNEPYERGGSGGDPGNIDPCDGPAPA